MSRIDVGSGVKRARLGRILSLACGCIVELPTIDSADSGIVQLAKRFIERPRYHTRCGGKPGHRSLAEVTRG